ncbi:unnamed protein product [Phaedon cochleariae]|uniref:Uncharacterized protein n=1 Tax=Phaedon cochleariae TaxID=80249 RepID=A0A9N9SDH2_PHACE|nr:unnamed protein product [Phaedon cochleariae]
MMLATVILVLVLDLVNRTDCHDKQRYNIGGIFSDAIQEAAFRIATYTMNNKYPYSQIELVPSTSSVLPHNTLEAYRSTCGHLQNASIAIFGPGSSIASPFIQSLCDAKEIPHIETHRDFEMNRNDTLVNVHPHPRVLTDFFIDLIESFRWKKVIVIYDDDNNLLSVAPLLEFNNKKGRKVILKQLEYPDEQPGNYRPMLNKVKLLGEMQFVLACSIDILENVLKQLQQVGMMTEIYSYLITNLDLQTIDIEPFQYGGTNITGIRMIDPDLTEVKRISMAVRDSSDSHKLRVETALLIDAVQLFYETIYDLTIDRKMIIQARPINCKSTDNWKYGDSIINLMKSKSTLGLTGLMKFDNEGFRRDFKIDVLELYPQGLIKVGEWNSTLRTIDLQRPVVENFQKNLGDNLFNTTFIVLISLTPPYGMLKETTTQLIGNDRFEGFGIDVIKELSGILGFNYTFILQEDGLYGNRNKSTGKWNGMIREIIDGRADLAITDLTVTSERESAVDFTMPFMNLGISILYRKPEPVPPSLFMFASPFSFYVWLLLGISYFIVSLSFFVMGRLSPSEWQNPYPCVDEPEYLVNQFTIRNSFWFTMGALMQQGSELAPVAISTRTASGVWWLFVLIMVSSYTANLAAFLTVETLVTPFNDIDELAAQQEIKFGAKKNGATANYFRDSNLTKYKQVWSYMVHHPELMMDSNEDGVVKVENENYAFLMESTTIEYVTERHCTLARVGGLLDDKGYGIAMKRYSPYRNDLSTAVLQLQEKSILTGLKIKWWKEKRGGGRCASKSEAGEATPLDLKNVGGVFLVLFIGTILGMMGSFAEMTNCIYKRSRRENVPFKEQFMREMRFFVQFKQSVKEVNNLPPDSVSGKHLMNNSTKTIDYVKM